MIESIRSFFEKKMVVSSEAEPAEDEVPPIQVAACALLLELAYADDDFADLERQHLEAALRRHFALDPDTVQSLIALAESERRQAVDLFQFTNLIAAAYDDSQKAVLLEVMWGLVYADGVVAEHETKLMRRVSRLLDVRPGFLADARKRAAEKVQD